jgi:hypothetical protein
MRLATPQCRLKIPRSLAARPFHGRHALVLADRARVSSALRSMLVSQARFLRPPDLARAIAVASPSIRRQRQSCRQRLT